MPFAQPEDRRYTDPRFPALEIHNDGGPVFVIYENGVAFDEFRAYENPGSNFTSVHDPLRGGAANTVSEAFAARRAQQYFDRMAGGQLSAELLARPGPAQPNRLGVRNDTEPMGVKPEAGPVNRLQWQSKAKSGSSTPHPKGPLGSPLPPGEEFGKPEDLDALIARARETGDQRLWKQAMSWMQQESAAQRAARILLDL